MRGKWSRTIILTGLAAAALFTAACGTVATPEWAAEAQSTRVAQAATTEHLTAIAPTATPIPPTETPTPLPPTATLVPPTATPTTEPTAAPTIAPTAEDTAGTVAFAGDATAGQAVFQQTYTLPDGQAWACMSCHSITPDELRLIGPGLWNIANRAETYGTGETAVEYIYHSIVAPADFIAPVAEGQPGWALAMPHGFGDVMTQEEIDNVTAYLLTLQ